MKLDGKVAIVTGGSRGIGRAIATEFLHQGAQVAILARTVKEIEKTVAELSSLGQVVGYTCDVSVERQVSKVHQLVKEEFGPVSVLVNAAGVVGELGPFEETNHQTWWNTMQINLYGTYLWSRAVIHQMIQCQQGKIINLSGAGASPRANYNAYAVSKAGVVRLTETLAWEVRKYNIQINAIAPGPVKTKMTKEMVQAGLAAGAEEFENAQKLLAEETQPIKAADLAIYLACSESDGITGKLISALYDNWPEWSEYTDTLANSELYTQRRLDPFTIRKLVPLLNLPLERSKK